MKTLAALLLVALGARIAVAADDVHVSLATPLVYPGETARVSVEITDSEDPVKSLDLTAPKGFTVRGPFQGVQKMSSVNNVRTFSVEVGYRLNPPEGAKGAYEIGPLKVTRKSGKTESYPVGKLTVGARPDRGVRMTVTPVPPSGPVGMPFVATYRILYSGKPYEGQDAFGSVQHPYGLTHLELPVRKSSDVRVEAVNDGASASLGIGNDFQLGITRGSASTANGVFHTIEFRLRITPLTTGPVELSASVGMAIVDHTERRRDFFGGVVDVPVAREFQAKTGSVVYKVHALPEAGQPRGFSGAVGQYSVRVAANPTEVNAYDPIDVKITVAGRGVLEKVALPRYADFPEISKDFEVDSDQDPGKVDGDTKVFHVNFRPRSSAVKSLPALPLPYYDPWKRSYEVALSSPVPLIVHDVKTVRAEDSVGPPEPSGEGANPGAAKPISARLGIGANYETLDAGETRLVGRPPLFTPVFLLVLLVPPALFGAAWIAAVLGRRPKDVVKGTPLSAALAALAAAGGPDGAGEALADYLRRRLELPPGEITGKELERALTARVVPEPVVARLLAHWEALEQARFAGGTGTPTGIEETIRELDRCLA